MLLLVDNLGVIIDVQVNDAVVEVMEGEAKSVLCEAVEKHRASMLVVGSHGHGKLKRYY